MLDFFDSGYFWLCLFIAVVPFFGWRKSTEQWQRDIARIAGIVAALLITAFILVFCLYWTMV